MDFLKRNSISLHRVFKSCADSTIKLFLPILIYEKTQSLIYAFVFFLVNYFLWGVLNLLLKPLIEKKPLLLVSINFIPWVLILAYINFITITISGVFILGILSAFAGVLYSVPINIIFTANKRTNNVAKFDSAAIVGKIIFTALTAYLIGTDFKDSFLLLLILGSSLYIISSMFIVINKNEINGLLKNVKAKKVSQSMKLNTQFNTLNSFFGTFQGVIDTILPLFLYYYNFSLQQVAFIIILSEIIKIGANFLAKYLQSKQKENILILITCLIYTLAVILIIFIQKTKLYYVVSLILPLTFPLIHVSIFSKYIEHIKNNDDLIAGHIVRDFFILTPRSFVYSTFFLTTSFTPIFIIGALTSVGIIINNYLIKPTNKKIETQNEISNNSTITTE